jgi:hypothetical protein
MAELNPSNNPEIANPSSSVEKWYSWSSPSLCALVSWNAKQQVFEQPGFPLKLSCSALIPLLDEFQGSVLDEVGQVPQNVKTLLLENFHIDGVRPLTTADITPMVSSMEERLLNQIQRGGAPCPIEHTATNNPDESIASIYLGNQILPPSWRF